MNISLGVRTLALCLGWLLVAGKCFADLPKPPVPPPNELPSGAFRIRPCKVTTNPELPVLWLKIPRQEFNAITQENAPKQSNWAPARTQSIVAAMVASIGLASIVFLRMNRSAKIAMLFVVGVVCSGAAAEAWWNAPPPFNLPTKPAATVSERDFKLPGRLVIQVTDSGSMELAVGTKTSD